MKPMEVAFWVVVFFALSAMASAVYAQAADEPLVAVTTQLPASKAEKCAKEGCLILTEEEAEKLVQEAMAAHKPTTCRAGREV